MGVYKLDDWIAIRFSSSKAPERVSTISSPRQWHFVEVNIVLMPVGFKLRVWQWIELFLCHCYFAHGARKARDLTKMFHDAFLSHLKVK